MNPIFLVERIMYRITMGETDLSEEIIKECSTLLGQPTKKLDVLKNRYKQVFGKYIIKRCTRVDSEKLCLYTLNQRVPFKLMPVTMYATGTILLFRDEEPVDIIAYPMPKALSYMKTSGIPIEEYGSTVPREVSVRLDGWQLNAYYNPILRRWIFATRYVLHNMYFERGKLVEEPFETIANPYVYVADRLAEELGIYSVLDKYRGWTFIFILLGPEPAITHPPYPLGSDYKEYKLVPLLARDSEGKLYTWSETSSLLGIAGPPLVECKKLEELYEDAKKRIDIRSYIAFIDYGNPEHPLLIELESELYPEAMNVKYLYSAKSAAILICEGYGDKLASIVSEELRPRVDQLKEHVVTLEQILLNIALDPKIRDRVVRLVNTVNSIAKKNVISLDEVVKNLEKGNIKRIVKKVVGLVLEGHSLMSEEPISLIKKIVEEIIH